jgi:ubiquinone/menaquinone biosynthesis C-methylase UbiE
MSVNTFEQWTNIYKKEACEGTDHKWPTETLIRLFKGTYVPQMDKNFEGKKILDVSCGNGSNLLFLGTIGMEIHGTEVTQELCDFAKKTLGDLGYKADIRVGTNKQLPYDDNTFDYLVSWNVIHYENTEEDVRAGLAEYRRVLKPGGRFFVCTAGPKHEVLINSKTLGGHRYEIGREDDFRKGQVFFYFDAPNYIQFYFDAFFNNVMIGEVCDHLFTKTINFYLVTGVKA